MTNIPKIEYGICDIETNGFLDQLDRIHCLVIRDFLKGDVYRFRKNDVEDTIEEGLKILEEVDYLIFHNGLAFDLPAIQKIYPNFNPKGKIRDTLILSRVVFSDQKDRDFRLYEQGIISGADIGSNRLESWGFRLGVLKTEYSKIRKEKAKELGLKTEEEIFDFVWGKWNEDMDDYCVDDCTVTAALWQHIIDRGISETALVLEHQIADIMAEQERNGWPFNVEEAIKLATSLEQDEESLIKAATEHFGYWWAPVRKMQTMPLWDVKEGRKRRKKKTPGKKTTRIKEFYEPRPELGETDPDRAVWADIVIPKKTINYKDKPMQNKIAGAAYCPIKKVEFNPGSRNHIIDRFTTVYNWEPKDFTDKGNPIVDDTVLRKLEGKVPMARELAEIFYTKKRLGQIKTGDNAWLKVVGDDGRIHHTCVVGGAVTGRATHMGPNLAQVPKVVIKRIDNKNVILTGREGLHGWDCRRLFTVPQDTHIQVGCDLEGIELRCFGELLSPFDGGKYSDVLLNGDIHTFNQINCGLDSRDTMKTLGYAFLYGAGDEKMGSIINPLADEDTMIRLGAEARHKLLNGIEGLKELMKLVKSWARKGFVPGLDGRFIPVRSEHAALNSKLQSDAALIAKKWIIEYYYSLMDQGLECGWDRDFVFLGWIHDENQSACLKGLENILVETSERTAAEAGKFFGYKIPIAAKAKVGTNWAETH